MKNVCMVCLNDDGECMVGVFPMAVYGWITREFSPPSPGMTYYREVVPEGIRQYLEPDMDDELPTHVDVTVGSPDNDRALSLNYSMESLEHAIKYCSDHDLVVEKSYHGLCY